MAVSVRRAVCISSDLLLLLVVLTGLSLPVSAQEMVFKDVKKQGIATNKVVETANMYADVLQFDVKGKVKDETITEVINVIVPKGYMTPQEIMLENIYGLVTIGAGPEYLILKEILVSENRRKAVMKGIEQSVFILGDLVENSIPPLNMGSKLVIQGMNQATSYFADVLVDIMKGFRDAVGFDRRRHERLKKVMPDRPPMVYPPHLVTVHPLCEGPWVFIWAEPLSPHGVKAYDFKLRNPNTREVLLETTVEKNYVVVPQQSRNFAGRKEKYWYWTVRAIGGDNAEGLYSIRGFYVQEREK